MRVRRVLGTLAVGILISLSVSPAVLAQGGPATPADAVTELASALDAGRYSDVADLVCAEQRSRAARRLDLSTVIRDIPASSRPVILRLVDVHVSDLAVTILEEDAEHAVAQVTGRIVTQLDESGLTRALRALDWPDTTLDAALRRAVVGQRIRERLESLPSPAVLDRDVELRREGDGWTVCGDLGWGVEPLDPSDVCGLLSIAELRILAPLDLTERSADAGACTYAAAAGSGLLSTVQVRLEDGGLALVRSAYPDGSTLQLSGMEAYAAAGSVWVDLGSRLLTIQPTLIDASADVDPQRLALAIAAVTVPRIDP